MRTPSCDLQPCLRKGSWSVEEDRKLVNYISKNGVTNWCKMSSYAGLTRTGKSCRLRWMNYLNPKIKRGNFTNEEEKTILHYHSVLGNRWAAIARKVPGRSDNEIKNHWHTHLKKRIKNPVLITKPKEITKSTDLHNIETSVESSVDHFFSTSVSDVHTSSSCIFDISSRSHHDQQQEVQFDQTSYNYDISSPGTVQDIKSFWEQLYYDNSN